MHFYISPYIDVGKTRIPKMILYIKDFPWTSIDLRNGFAIVAMAEKVSAPRTVHLCTCARTPSLAVRRHLERRFNCSFKEGGLGNLIYQGSREMESAVWILLVPAGFLVALLLGIIVLKNILSSSSTNGTE